MERENKTLATITFQNYFRMYKKLAGMTGTAKTEEQEFQSIYDLDVVEVPTNMPLKRIDNNDVVYTTEAGKLRAVVEEIAAVHKTGQPILVGTISVEKSELLSDMLKRRGIDTWCSTPSSTPGRRRSWPRQASWAASPSPPTWRAAARISSWAQPGVFGPAGSSEPGHGPGAAGGGHQPRGDRGSRRAGGPEPIWGSLCPA